MFFKKRVKETIQGLAPELTAEQVQMGLLAEANQPTSTGNQEKDIVGVITDQQQVSKFIEWLGSEEARALGRKLREREG